MIEETERGIEFSRVAERYGDTGWVEITDERVLAHLEFYTDTSDGYAPLILTAVKLAKLVEAARREVDSAPWEDDLTANLDRAAALLRLRMDPVRFRLSGKLRGMTTSLRLEAHDMYVLHARIRLPTALPDGYDISPRLGFWSKLAARIGLDRPSRNPTFDAVFKVNGAICDRFSNSVVDHLVALSKEGDVRVKSDTITFRSERLTLDVSRVLQQLATIAAELQGQPTRSPYRDVPE
jgi:hypothetical protein